jgi:hypothetical protein
MDDTETLKKRLAKIGKDITNKRLKRKRSKRHTSKKEIR